MAKIIFILVFLNSSFVFAEEYIVSGSGVNFRSTARFTGKDNIIKELDDATRLTLVKDHGDYVEVVLTADGTKGFIWKDYVESTLTHDYYKSPSAAFPTITPDTVDSNIASSDAVHLPLCGCGNSCRVGSPYGFRKHPIRGGRRMHHGCDFPAPKGTAVYAMADGKVKKSGRNGGYGITVEIEHLSMLRKKDGKVASNRGYTTRYAHLHRTLVSVGQAVKRGQKIGLVNTTGSSTGNHLHFEIAVTGRTMNPAEIFDFANIKKSCSNAVQDSTKTVQ